MIYPDPVRCYRVDPLELYGDTDALDWSDFPIEFEDAMVKSGVETRLDPVNDLYSDIVASRHEDRAYWRPKDFTLAHAWIDQRSPTPSAWAQYRHETLTCMETDPDLWFVLVGG